MSLETGEIVIRRKTLHLGTRLIEDEEGPERESSERTIDLLPVMAETLRRHWDRQRFLREQLGPAWARPDLVLTTRYGQPQRANVIESHYLPRFLEKAGSPTSLTLHTLRRPCATRLLANGADPSRVAWMLGHDVVTLMRTHRAVLPYEGKKLAQQLEAILTEPADATGGDGEGRHEEIEGA